MGLKTLLKLKTWHIESLVVSILLASTTIITGSRSIEWLGSLAVLITFMHKQVGFRLAEAEERRTQHAVHCHRWLRRYFLLKEACWLSYFIWLGAWSALVGVGIFLIYPLWRKYR